MFWVLAYAINFCCWVTCSETSMTVNIDFNESISFLMAFAFCERNTQLKRSNTFSLFRILEVPRDQRPGIHLEALDALEQEPMSTSKRSECTVSPLRMPSPRHRWRFSRVDDMLLKSSAISATSFP